MIDQRIHRIAADQDIHLHHRRNPVPVHVVIERSIAARDDLQPVVEIQHDLVQRKFVGQHHARLGDVLEVHLAPALVFHQLQDPADILFVGQDLRQDHRLFDRSRSRRDRASAKDCPPRASSPSVMRDVVAHARRGRDQVQVVLALQPLLDDLQMQQPEKAAAESKTQRNRRLGLEREARIVQPQLFERVAQHARVHASPPCTGRQTPCS